MCSSNSLQDDFGTCEILTVTLGGPQISSALSAAGVSLTAWGGAQDALFQSCRATDEAILQSTRRL